MRFADRLRPPSPGDRSASAYKDWLHFNLFDPASRTALVLNASLHGDPDNRRSTASATALVRRGESWTFHSDVIPLRDARVDDRAVAIGEQMEMCLDPVSGGADVAFRDPSSDLAINLTTVPLARSINTYAPVPFGSGWICWRAVPLLRTMGELRERNLRICLDDALAYHDHNWGRWHWGDDIGWEWAAWMSAECCLVMSRATDRGHRSGAPNVCVSLPTRRGWRNWSYGAGSVHVRLSDWRRGCVARVPGSMAGLHTERMSPRLPMTIDIEIDDGFDNVTARMEVDDAIQVIAADPHVAGYSFIHELIGTFRASGATGGHAFDVTGDGVFEYVD